MSEWFLKADGEHSVDFAKEATTLRKIKPHRQIRTSRRVSSETGVAIDAMIANELPETPYQRTVNEIFAILHRLPPSLRRAALVYVAAQIEKEAQDGTSAEIEAGNVQAH